MKFKFKQEEILKAMMTADTDIAKLADVADVAINTVQKALKGKSVTMQTYFKLCRALNIAPDFQKEMF